MSTTWADVYKLESTIPLWLAEYLLFNKITSPPPAKVSFVLLPWPGTGQGHEPLPELLNTLVNLIYHAPCILNVFLKGHSPN